MELTEDYYRWYLERERRLYAWCLEHIGGRTPQEAAQAAAKVYRYQSPEEEYRWLAFHDLAWRVAMTHLFGHDYQLTHPEYAAPTAEYERESERCSA